ncbi:kinase-like domain-containing protein [Hyaloraphidium curvatum]|nr:kinase-like domain-containing protein [Hyaloraphidium curvatum]
MCRTADNPLLRSIPSLSFRPPSPTHKRINLMDMHGCLRSHESLPPTALRTLFRGAAEAVLFLHREKGVAHGDLKPQNLLVDERYGVKVADFSAARGTGEGRVRRFAGAPMFGAPEALGGDFDGELNDIWALGVILYMLRYGPDREPEFAQAGAATRVVLPADSMPDDGEIKDLLSRMLDRDPSRRPRIEQVAAHPFVGLLPPSERDGDRATGTKEGKRPLETEGSDATLGEATRGKGLRGWLGRIAG